MAVCKSIEIVYIALYNTNKFGANIKNKIMFYYLQVCDNWASCCVLQKRIRRSLIVDSGIKCSMQAYVLQFFLLFIQTCFNGSVCCAFSGVTLVHKLGYVESYYTNVKCFSLSVSDLLQTKQRQIWCKIRRVERTASREPNLLL